MRRGSIVSDPLLSRLSKRVAPQQMLMGDRFKRMGAEYEVVRVERGKYSTLRVISRRLSLEDVGFDYQEIVEVTRAAS